jgi:hypothetical protein
MFSITQNQTYQNKIIGNWGSFEGPGGRVEYVSTKAKLGGPETSNERRLTALLRPVREMLPVSTLDFGQLLQRDLDDHRVATSLIPYLLKQEGTTPAFFPPIIAVLLPFDVDQPANFEAEGESSLVNWLGNHAQERVSGDAYRSLKHCDPSGKLYETQLGSLEWNDERGKLVVLDGQHRAMALLAIYRTISKTWKTSGAERYSHFYESGVEALLTGKPISLDRIEVPVTVCWFPDLAGRDMEPHKAARKLFVDLNREARAPSEARLTLLSDSELVSIFARSLLNKFRTDQNLSLYSIDYDNPEPDSGKVSRWSALTNLECLKTASRHLVFGPSKILDDVTYRIPSGKLPQKTMDEFMRTQLCVDDYFKESILDGDRTIARSELGNTNFPKSLIPNDLEDAFAKTWGAAIAKLLGALVPFKAHNEAIVELYAGWVAPDGASSLAKEALFDGVGMYWTLRSSAEFYSQREAEAKAAKAPVPPKGDVVKAWSIVKPGGDTHKDFRQRRAKKFLGSSNTVNLEESDQAFSVFCTSACQIGMFLAFGTLVRKCKVPAADVLQFSEVLANAWNAAMNSNAGSRSRKLIFSKEVKNPINTLGKIDSTSAVFFRYMWLELLSVEQAVSILDAHPATYSLAAQAGHQAGLARRFYMDHLTSEQGKSLKQLNPALSIQQATEQAQPEVTKALRKSLTSWFGKSAADFDSWFAALASKVVAPEIDAADLSDANYDEGGEGYAGDPNQGVVGGDAESE